MYKLLAVVSVFSVVESQAASIVVFPSRYDACAGLQGIWNTMRLSSILFDLDNIGQPSTQLTPYVWASINRLRPGPVDAPAVCSGLDDAVNKIMELGAASMTHEITPEEMANELGELVENSVQFIDGEASGLNFLQLAQDYSSAALVTPATVMFPSCVNPGFRNAVPMDFQQYMQLKKDASQQLSAMFRNCQGCIEELAFNIFAGMNADEEVTNAGKAAVFAITQKVKSIAQAMFERASNSDIPTSARDSIIATVNALQEVTMPSDGERAVTHIVEFLSAVKQEVVEPHKNTPISRAFAQNFARLGC